MVENIPKDGMIKRNIQEKLEEALLRSPVVLLTGARQTGKTTLMKQIGQEKNYTYVSFDDIRFLSAAKNDPIGFIAGLKKPVILDEVQRVPEIFLAIKQDVDENRTPGMYILTGSANPLLIPKLGDSLAGRMEIFTLYPLSQGELAGIKEKFIDTIFNNQLPTSSTVLPKEELYEKMSKGGYPLVQDFDESGRESWFNGYIVTILQRDVKDISNITGISDLPLVLHLLATRVANLLNVAELSRATQIPVSTLDRYLTLLQTVYLIHLQQPWFANLGNRLVRAPKINFVDTGLLSFQLGIHVHENSIIEGRMIGPILENFVVGELYKQMGWSSMRVKLYHFRTAQGFEVDVVLENAAGQIVCIEIKKSSTVIAEDFKGLKYIQELTGNKFVAGIVLYTGTEHIPFGQKLFALPIQSLWSK